MSPRIAIGGMAIEASTFSPHRSGASDFTVVRGPALLGKYPALPPNVEWIPLVHARALPGGAVERAFYDSMRAELLAGLRAALPLDGVYLDIHGAMTVVGMIDAEGDLATAIREVVGPGCLISGSMDPHGNMSRRLIGALDLATSHRMSPHDDAPLTKRRAIANLVGCLERGVRPLRAWVRVPVLLPGERACTRDEPARSIYGSLSEVERRDGIIDAAVWIGYAWADEPRCSAAVVVTGTDAAAIGSAARELGRRYWDARGSFAFSVPAADAEGCIAAGLSRTARPFFISDSGDNPTAGGAGDTSYMLERLLADRRIVSGQATAIWASCVDPAAVAACVRAGAGAEVDLRVGGAFGSAWSTPLHGRVQRLREGDPVGGDIAVIASGGVRAILTTRRKPYHYLADFADLGLDPAAHDLTVVKIGYLVPDLFAAAQGWMIALTPGGVDQHITRLPYRALERPIYPLDPDMADPAIVPELIGRSQT
ncbi:MAG TPA: M81 family metallopeptidase [Candidatus Limnocylindria bacterium]